MIKIIIHIKISHFKIKYMSEIIRYNTRRKKLKSAAYG